MRRVGERGGEGSGGRVSHVQIGRRGAWGSTATAGAAIGTAAWGVYRVSGVFAEITAVWGSLGVARQQSSVLSGWLQSAMSPRQQAMAAASRTSQYSAATGAIRSPAATIVATAQRAPISLIITHIR